MCPRAARGLHAVAAGATFLYTADFQAAPVCHGRTGLECAWFTGTGCWCYVIVRADFELPNSAALGPGARSLA